AVKGDLDFSFSGLKTAVLRYVRARSATIAAGPTASATDAGEPVMHGPLGREGVQPAFSDQEIADICASVQRVIVKSLIDRASDAGQPGHCTGVTSGDPFLAKIIASNRAGCVWLAFLETSCVAPGCS